MDRKVRRELERIVAPLLDRLLRTWKIKRRSTALAEPRQPIPRLAALSVASRPRLTAMPLDTVRFALSLGLLLASTPALACHRFHHWDYPLWQRCVVPKITRPGTSIILIKGDNKSDTDNNWHETLPR
jgi:hypothetical protein